MGIYTGPRGSQLAPRTPMELKTRATEVLGVENAENNPLHPVPPPSAEAKGQTQLLEAPLHPQLTQALGAVGKGVTIMVPERGNQGTGVGLTCPRSPTMHSRTGGSRTGGRFCKPTV